MIYLTGPPESIPCLYCNEQCAGENWGNSYAYYCKNHDPAVILYKYQYAPNKKSWWFKCMLFTVGSHKILLSIPYDSNNIQAGIHELHKNIVWGMVEPVDHNILFDCAENVAQRLMIYVVFS